MDFVFSKPRSHKVNQFDSSLHEYNVEYRSPIHRVIIIASAIICATRGRGLSGRSFSAIILPKNLSRSFSSSRTHASRGRSSSTSCARRWTMTSTCRNGRERRGRRAPNIYSADLVRGSRRYCSMDVCVCAVAHSRTQSHTRRVQGVPGNDHHAISAFCNLRTEASDSAS